jgi:hypothetical protein
MIEFRAVLAMLADIIEQRDVIKFFADEGDQGIEIRRRFMEHSGDRVMFRSE